MLIADCQWGMICCSVKATSGELQLRSILSSGERTSRKISRRSTMYGRISTHRKCRSARGGSMLFTLCPRLGLLRVLEYLSTTQIVNYSSNVLLIEYSLLSLYGCKFLFQVAVFAVNCWIVGIYGNLGLYDFICPLASLEIDLNVHI